jgi:hypothetical protein
MWFLLFSALSMNTFLTVSLIPIIIILIALTLLYSAAAAFCYCLIYTSKKSFNPAICICIYVSPFFGGFSSTTSEPSCFSFASLDGFSWFLFADWGPFYSSESSLSWFVEVSGFLLRAFINLFLSKFYIQLYK